SDHDTSATAGVLRARTPHLNLVLNPPHGAHIAYVPGTAVESIEKRGASHFFLLGFSALKPNLPRWRRLPLLARTCPLGARAEHRADNPGAESEEGDIESICSHGFF